MKLIDLYENNIKEVYELKEEYAEMYNTFSKLIKMVDENMVIDCEKQRFIKDLKSLQIDFEWLLSAEMDELYPERAHEEDFIDVIIET